MREFLFVLAVAAATVIPESPAVKELKQGNLEFTIKTYRELAKDNTNNLLVSPLSVEIVLALVESGANGDSAKQIITGLNLPSTEEKIHEAFKAITPNFHHDNVYTLVGANKIYVKEGFNLKPEFKLTATDVFNANIQEIDFTSNEALAQINKWVKDKTRDKIKSILTKDDLDADTRVLLINSLYFHGLWSNPFELSSTTEKPFHLNSKSDVKVKMMEQTEKFFYYKDENLKAKFLEMQYYGSPITMTIVLPDDVDGLSELEKNLDTVLSEKKYTYTKVHVQIPQVKIEETINFGPILKEFGIENIFGKDADLSRMSDTKENLYISKVIQKTFIAIEETGTTAAAVTVGIAVAESIELNPPPIQEFEANHPFIFIIRSPDGILFTGRYVKPN